MSRVVCMGALLTAVIVAHALHTFLWPIADTGGPLERRTSDCWAVVLDCGSSGTRARLFSYSLNVPLSIRPYQPHDPMDAAKLEVSPGVASFLDDHDRLAESLLGLLAQARRWIPESEIGRTRLYAYATAGMRLLEPTDSHRVWSAVRSVLAATEFDFREGRTLSGEREGVFLWLSLNFLSGSLFAKVPQFTGVMDLGGASTQIAFSTGAEPPRTGAALVEVAGSSSSAPLQTFNLFTASFMRLGQDEAYRYLLNELHDGSPTQSAGHIQNPCQVVGYEESEGGRRFVGVGSWDECYTLVKLRLLGLGGEVRAPCMLQPCGPWQRHIPRHDAADFIAIAAYDYEVERLGLISPGRPWANADLSLLRRNGTAWCARGGANDIFSRRTCFASVLAFALLVDGFGFPASGASRITFSRSIEVGAGGESSAPPSPAVNLDWTLGALVFELSREVGRSLLRPERTPSSNAATMLYVGLELGLAIGFFALLTASYLGTLNQKRLPKRTTAPNTILGGAPRDDDMNEEQKHSLLMRASVSR